MKHLLFWPKQFVLTQTGKMCFGVAAGAFLAAALGFIVNQFLVGWLATGGMIAIGLLYVAMGLMQIRVCKPKEPAKFVDKFIFNESHNVEDTLSHAGQKNWNFPSDFHVEDEEPHNAMSNSQ